MPQIAGLPIDEAVPLPQAKPAQFGGAAAAVAELGEQSEQLALESSQVEARLAFAHRQLKAKQAEIAIDRYTNNVYADLAKQTTVDGVQATLTHAQDPNNVGPLLAPFQGDRQLGQMVTLAWQQAQVGLERQATIHKAHIIQEGTKEADALNEAKTGMQAVQVKMAGGDDDTVKIFRDRYEMGLQNGEAAGVYTPEQVKSMMYQWDQGYMKSLADAGMDSPDEATRKRTISELKAGGGSYSGLDPATRNALYDKALERNERLTNLSEAADLDAATAHFKQLTKGLPLESQMQLANDDDWAVKNGFSDENGNPKRKLLDKISEDINRQQIWQKKVQGDKDNDIIEKYLTDIDSGKLSDVAIDQIGIKEGASPRAISQMKAARKDILRQELELNTLSLQAQSLRRQQWQDQSFDQLGKIQKDIQNGVRHSDEEINSMLGRGSGKMSSQQVSEALRMSHSYETDPTNKPFYNTIWNSQSLTDQNRGEAVSELDKYIREHPNADTSQKQRAVNEILEPKNVDRINKSLDGLGDVFNPSPTAQLQTPSSSIATMVTPNPRGLVSPGNIQINNRPVVHNSDGSRSTEYSISFEDNGVEVLVPTVVNGKFLTPDGKKPPEGSKAEKEMFRQAEHHYHETGENLGKFKTARDADAYAKQLHERGASPTKPSSVPDNAVWNSSTKTWQLQQQ